MNQFQACSTAPQGSAFSHDDRTTLLHNSLLCLSVPADKIYNISLKHPSWRRLNPQIPNHLTFNECHETLQPPDQHQSLFGLTDEHATNGQFNIDHEGILHMSDDSLVNNNDSSHSTDPNWYSQLTIEADMNSLHSHYPQSSSSHHYFLSPLNQDDYSMTMSVQPAMPPTTLPAFSPGLNSPMSITDPQAFSPPALDSPPHTPVSLSTSMVLSTPVPPSVPVTPSPSVASESDTQLTCIDPSLLNIATPAQATTSTITGTQGHNSISLDGAPQPQGLFLMVPFYPYPYPGPVHMEPVSESSLGQGNHVGPPK